MKVGIFEDSEDNLSNLGEPLEVGNNFDIFLYVFNLLILRANKKKWCVGKVLIVGEEMVKFSVDEGKDNQAETVWIEIDSDKIASFRSKTDNNKRKEFDLLLAFNDQWK